MIIHQPEIIQKDGYAILWAKIEMAKKREHFPNYLWYRVPEQYAPYLSPQSDAFLVSSLLAAMHFGEDIQVRGTTSPHLAYNLSEYQFLLNFRMPKVLHPVSIRYASLDSIGTSPAGVGSTFTGGVDSLFTIWKHLPQNQPDPNYQISHAIFIQGFDILHTEKNKYKILFNQYAEQTSKIGIELIELSTNMISITHQQINRDYLFGPQIISAGLVLPRLFKRFFVSSSWDYYTLQKRAYTADPLADRFLSTDTMDIIHFGSVKRRNEKLEQIANWEVAQKLLWVCCEVEFDKHSWNCSRCIKCQRTMIPLYAMGVLGKFKTFEKPITKNSGLLWHSHHFKLNHNYLNELLPYLKRKKPNLIIWLFIASILGLMHNFLIRFSPSPIKRWLQRFGYFIISDSAPDAYERPKITQLIREYDDHPST